MPFDLSPEQLENLSTSILGDTSDAGYKALRMKLDLYGFDISDDSLLDGERWERNSGLEKLRTVDLGNTRALVVPADAIRRTRPATARRG